MDRRAVVAGAIRRLLFPAQGRLRRQTLRPVSASQPTMKWYRGNTHMHTSTPTATPRRMLP